MRVLLLIGTLQVGGAERNVVDLLPHLQAAGADVTLCTLTDLRDSFLADEVAATGIVRHDLAARRLLDPRAALRLRRLLRHGRIEVVHAQDHAGALMGAAVAASTRTAVVVTRHVLRYPDNARRERLKGALLDGLMRRGPVDRVIAVADDARRYLIEDVGVPPERVVTVHNGLRVDRLESPLSVAEARRANGWPVGGRIVTMIAVIREGKGHEVLLDAVPAIRAAAGDVTFLIVGDGELAPAIGVRAAALGGVVLTGYRDDIATVLRASDVVVLPSFAEALPTVLIEAGAAGVPVVATNVGGAAEIVDHGSTGYLVPPGDSGALASAVARLLGDLVAATAMGEAARIRIAEQFSLERQAEATVQVYRDVVPRGT